MEQQMDDDDGSIESPPFPGSEAERRHFVAETREMRERVLARVIHLNDHGRSATERAVRILRAFFVDRRRHSPKQGTLHTLMLVGDAADPNVPTLRPGREKPDYEIWAFVDHDEYKGMDQHWGEARRMLASEVGHFATFTLSVFTTDEASRFRLANRFLAERYERGLILYDRATDAPRDTRAQAAHDRIMAEVEALPEQARAAFRCYRRHGFDMASLASRLGMAPVVAESRLCEAFGRLLSSLKNNAQPRSLRPGIDDHPRHNLDLFHRPADRERLLALPRYQFAEGCVATMTHAAEREWSSMVVHQAGYAAEFALKAILLRAGYTDHWNREHIGLDTGAALQEAMTCGLPSQHPDMVRLIERLGRFHSGLRLEKDAAPVLALMPPAAIVAAIRDLFRTIGRMTGYDALPREVEL